MKTNVISSTNYIIVSFIIPNSANANYLHNKTIHFSGL